MRVDDNSPGQQAGPGGAAAGGAGGAKLTNAELAKLAGAGAVRELGPETKGADAAGGQAQGTDQVRFSALASKVGDGASSREARLEELRALVDAGEYEPDMEAVARRMIDDALMVGDQGAEPEGV